MKSFLIVLLTLLSLTGCAYKKRLLYEPAAITVASSNSNSAVRSKVRSTLQSYQWIIEKDTPGQIIAKQIRGQHSARIQITYNSKQATIKYLDSQNLNYHVEDGAERIHSRYNIWVQNVERMLASQLS